MKNSVTIVIPAFREEDNIEAAIDNAVSVAQGVTQDYEIIVVDDGSPDKTGDFARLKAQVNPHIRVAVNASNEGFGFSFARGVKMAGKEFITVFPGDNDMSADSLKDLLQARGSADLVVSYMQKTDKRSIFRRVVSRTFVIIRADLRRDRRLRTCSFSPAREKLFCRATSRKVLSQSKSMEFPCGDVSRVRSKHRD